MNNKKLFLLYQSFDKRLNKNQQKALDAAMESSEELKQHQTKIKKMRILLSSVPPEPFSDGFIDRLMSKIGTVPVEPQESIEYYHLLLSFFKPLALAAAVLIICLTLYNAYLFKTGVNPYQQSVINLLEPNTLYYWSCDR